jgi:hypothetical protein
MKMNFPVDPLDELLNRCQPAPEPPAQLAAKIRRRFAERRTLAGPAWPDRLDAVFARPSFAAAFITACMLLGLFLAERRVSRMHEAQGVQIARSYLQLIDPLLGPTPAAPLAPTRSP